MKWYEYSDSELLNRLEELCSEIMRRRLVNNCKNKYVCGYHLTVMEEEVDLVNRGDGVMMCPKCLSG